MLYNATSNNITTLKIAILNLEHLSIHREKLKQPDKQRNTLHGTKMTGQ